MNKLYLVSIIVMIITNLVFFISFERTKPRPKDILPLVVICCGASLGRVIMAAIPQVQPVTALVIIAGSVYGCRRGYVTGALCALVSNLFLGQGPWTIFQMTAWGSIGFLAGLIGKRAKMLEERQQTKLFAVYGFLAAFLFSIITDFSTISYLGENVNLPSVIAVYVAGITFNIGHGIFNFILLMFLYGSISRKLKRIQRKTMR